AAARQRPELSPVSNSHQHRWDQGQRPALPRRWLAHAAFSTQRLCLISSEAWTRSHPERRPFAPAQRSAPEIEHGLYSMLDRNNRGSMSDPALRTPLHTLGQAQWLSHTSAALAHWLLC